MKSVLISIQPKWCERIANGKKTIEVRKTRPNLETPFKCYIYQIASNEKYKLLSGKVIGEFVCDKVDEQIVFHKGITRIMIRGYKEKLSALCEAAALSLDELHEYIDKDGKDLEIIYGWHISDLKIYNEPKYICDFKRLKPKSCFAQEYTSNGEQPCMCCICCSLSFAPQSWRYVEEQNEYED